MKRGAFILGVAMLVIGGYSFWWSMQSLFNMSFMDDWISWIFSLVVGTIFVSLGPGVMVWAYASSYQASYRQNAKQKQWQLIQLPLNCSECSKDISIQSLEWIGDQEARCPYCSNVLEVRINSGYR